jgi:pilus assembly protein CpaB
MNRKVIIVVCAVVVGLIGTVIVFSLFAKAVASARPAGTSRVVAAASNVKLGTILKASDLAIIDIGQMPNGAILEKDEKSIIGRGVIADLYAGEPILESRLAAVGSGGGLAAAIPSGMRACAVKVDDVVGVSGFVTPGMHVDVIGSGTAPGSTGVANGTEARTLLQDLRVLSAGTDYQKDAEGKAKQVQVVNLLVTPDQAQTLSLAANQMRIQLVLRNPLDTGTGEVKGTAVANLFGQGMLPAKKVAAPKVGKARPEVYTVEVMNGTRGSVQTFPASEGR